MRWVPSSPCVRQMESSSGLSRPEGGSYHPPTFSANLFFFGSYDNFIYCLSRENGQLRWKQETGGYIHGSPVIVDDAVAVTGCDGFLRLIRISDGVEVERIELGAYIGSSPAYSQKRLYVGTFENQVLSFDLEEKEVEWVYEHTQRHFPFYSSPAVTKNLVVIGGRDKMVHGIDRSTGEIRWTFLTRSRVDSSPVVVGQTVLIADARGVLFRLALETGKELWQFDSAGGIQASPAISEGRLVIGTLDGDLYCLGGVDEK